MRVSDSIWFCEKGFSGLCTIEAEVDVVNEELEVEVAIVLVISRKSRLEGRSAGKLACGAKPLIDTTPKLARGLPVFGGTPLFRCELP